jgi:hypothetical protein
MNIGLIPMICPSDLTPRKERLQGGSPRVLLRLVGGDPQAWDLLALPFVLSHHGYLASSRSAMWYARGLPLWRSVIS